MPNYYRWNKKTTTDESRNIDIFWLNKKGFFNNDLTNQSIVWTNSFGNKNSIGITISLYPPQEYAEVCYTITDQETEEKKDYKYKIKLDKTPCNLGGIRYWFICPLIKKRTPCNKRVTKLYMCSGSPYFGCRHCFGLSFESRNRSKHGIFGLLHRIFDEGNKVDYLYNNLKIAYRNGKPTKKYKEIKQIQNRLHKINTNFEDLP